jgi:hypothetical protein
MIDWLAVLAAALWILGLALLLALLGFGRSSPDQSMSQFLAQPVFHALAVGALILFAIGMGLTVDSWLERVGWLVVGLLGLWEGARGSRTSTH